MPYGKKAIEMRKEFLRSKEKTKNLSDYLSDEERLTLKSKEATIFDASKDPFEMCDPNKITKTKVDMNKLRRMKK